MILKFYKKTNRITYKSNIYPIQNTSPYGKGIKAKDKNRASQHPHYTLINSISPV